MRARTLALLAASTATINAAPNPLFASIRSLFTKTGGLLTYGDLGTSVLFEGVQHVVNDVVDVVKDVEEWVEDGKTLITESGVTFEQFKLNSLEQHSLRFKKPTLCDPSVKQYSGYLDITTGKHLFFWFFEARKNPENAPLLLWLNGGPGCSSSTGLLFELGPCSIAKEDGKPFTKTNPYSWTEYANIIFLDQPVNVGFSYSNDSSTVVTSPAAAEDVWAFLELFLNRFPEYSKLDFHVAAESYGGTYAPNIASAIWKKNKEIAEKKALKDDELTEINLKSVILANGITEPYTQFGTIPEFLCDGPFPVLDNDGPECANLRSKVPTCQRLVKGCYNRGSRLACVPAGLYCSSQLWAPLQQLGLNPYDVRKKCDKEEDGQLCYRQMEWIDEWMNLPEVQTELGALKGRTFQSCNMQVNQAFFFQGDGMHNSAALLPPLLNEGLKLLVYAGNADGMCNFIGNFEWMRVLEDHPYVNEFRNATTEPWVTHTDGTVAGYVRAAGAVNKKTGHVGSGSYTYVSVSNAGHMVPYDQPEAALDLFSRWVADKPLTS